MINDLKRWLGAFASRRGEPRNTLDRSR
jgi:hypothetical protein